jgi:hypothetical protein
MPAGPPQHLTGRELPAGSHWFEPYQNWLLHDALYSTPRQEPHPLAAFLIAQRGIGISVANLFHLLGSDITDGPLLAESAIELRRPLAEDTEYQVRGVIESVERRHSRRLGPFDRIACRFDILETAPGNGQAGPRDVVACVTNVFAIPRRAAGESE